MTTRLMVYVRVKPLDDEQSIIDVVDDQRLVFDPRREDQPTPEYYYNGRKFKSIGIKPKKEALHSFDGVFDANTSNYHIYETVTKPMVDATINGLNCSVFAYGATGSGKTHTMLGTPAYPGVIYYTSKDLFSRLATIRETDPLPADLKICYFEIYNEKVRDLLVLEPKNYFNCGNKRLRTTPQRCRARQQNLARDNYNLPVCDAPGDGSSLIIPDLTYHSPSNAEELIELLAAGNANRSQHPTDANAESSRSHAIFQIVLTRRLPKNNGSEYELQKSKMSLIDLAGSERASVAYRPGNDRSKNLQREGGNINKSLLALGNCINALADPKSAGGHIPYRNSKLTRLLKDSLGGRCRTAMIATVSQRQSHYDDTQSTLTYAARAKCVKLRPGRNYTNVAIQPKNYTSIIENLTKQNSMLQSIADELKIENGDLRNQMNTLEARLENAQFSNKSQRQEPPTFDLHQTFIKSSDCSDASNFLAESQYRSRLEDLYRERMDIKMEILKYESKLRMNQLRLALKESDELQRRAINGEVSVLNGNQTVTIGPNITRSLTSTDQPQALRRQQEYYDQERSALLDRAKLNEMHIQDVISSMTTEFQLKGYGTPEDFDLVMEPFVADKERCQEIEEKKFSEQHAYDIAQCVCNRLRSIEGLLVLTARELRYAADVARVRGFSDSFGSKLSQLFKKFEGKKSVVWKDDKYAMENNEEDLPLSKLSSVHDNFSLNFLTPFRNNNTLHSRRLSRNLVTFTNYTPDHSLNATFDASQ